MLSIPSPSQEFDWEGYGKARAPPRAALPRVLDLSNTLVLRPQVLALLRWLPGRHLPPLWRFRMLMTRAASIRPSFPGWSGSSKNSGHAVHDHWPGVDRDLAEKARCERSPTGRFRETRCKPARNVPETAPELTARRWRSTYSQELTMGTLIRKWRQALQKRRCRMTVERLTALSSGELHDLGIAPWDIDRLARKASQG